jgi:hypothetical protein
MKAISNVAAQYLGFVYATKLVYEALQEERRGAEHFPNRFAAVACPTSVEVLTNAGTKGPK